MLRRVQLTGKSTYIISLPKEWILKNKINKKDRVNVTYTTNKVIIRPVKVEYAKIIDRVDMSLLKKKIIASYIQGYDKILIKGLKHREITYLTRFIEEYLKGVDIGISKEEILITYIIDYDIIEVDSVFNNFFEKVKEIGDLSVRFKTRHIEDKYVDKESMFLKRVCLENIANPKIKNIDEKVLTVYYSLSSILENIADSFIEYRKIRSKHLNYALKILYQIHHAYEQRDILKLSYIADTLRRKKPTIKTELKDLIRLEIDLAEELIDLIG